jgi:hypothetical protein
VPIQVLAGQLRQEDLKKVPPENAGSSEEIFRENCTDFTW